MIGKLFDIKLIKIKTKKYIDFTTVFEIFKFTLFILVLISIATDVLKNVISPSEVYFIPILKPVLI